jgi:hypothetical protein
MQAHIRIPAVRPDVEFVAEGWRSAPQQLALHIRREPQRSKRKRVGVVIRFSFSSSHGARFSLTCSLVGHNLYLDDRVSKSMEVF